MFGYTMRWVLGVVLMIGIGGQFGCQEQLMRERDALWKQNKELQEALSRQQSALEGCEADRNRLLSRIDQVQSQRVTAPPPAPVQENAFSGIEGIEAIAGAGRVTVRVPGDVLFASGRVDLKSTAMKTLDQIAGVIQREYPGNTIRVEGYTDTDPIRKSKWVDNLELSLQRAAAVHRYLQKNGVDPQQLEAVGLGQWSPRQTKAKSRRVEIVVLMD